MAANDHKSGDADDGTAPAATHATTPATGATASPAPAPALTRTGSPPFFDRRDLRELISLPPLVLLAWALPERRWPGATRALGRVIGTVLPRRGAAYVPTIRSLMETAGHQAGSDAVLEAERVATHLRARLQLLRMYRRGGWRPDIRLTGRERLDAARADGRGAILWINQFASSDLVTKMAWHRAGLSVSHLSRPQHGFSETRFGRRWLNPMVTRIDERLLRERIVIPPSGPAPAMRLMAERLGDNGIVSITVTDMARQPVTAPFLDGTLRLAPGAAVLAADTGAALFPVFTLPEETGGFSVEIDEALDAAGAGSRKATVRAASQQLARRLESRVARNPLHWHSWELYEAT